MSAAERANLSHEQRGCGGALYFGTPRVSAGLNVAGFGLFFVFQLAS